MLAGGKRRSAVAKPPAKQLPRPVFGDGSPRWKHKKLRDAEAEGEGLERGDLVGPGDPSRTARGGGSGARGGGRSRSAKREELYLHLSRYSAHFSALLKYEWEAEQEALQAEICDWPLDKLKRAGLLLDRLCVRRVEELYGSPVLRLSLRPPAAGPRSQRSAALAAPSAPPLPYHAFSVGDAVSLCAGSAPVLPLGHPRSAGVGRHADGGEDPVPGVLLQRTDSVVLVVVPRLPADRMSALQAASELCLYRGASAIPFERNQAAIDRVTDPLFPQACMHPDLRDLILREAPLALPPPPRPASRRGGPKPSRAALGRPPAAASSAVKAAVAVGRPSYLDAAAGRAQVRAAVAAVAAASASPALNPSQVGAVTTALQRRLVLIQGPPGTGKTRTACHLLAACSALRRAGLGGGGGGAGGGGAAGGGGGTGKRRGGGPPAAVPVKSGVGVLAVAASNVAADELLSGLRDLGVCAVRLGPAGCVAEACREWTVEAMLAKDPAVSEARGALKAAQDARSGARVAAAFAALQRVEAAAARRLLLGAPVVVSTCIGAGKLPEMLSPPAGGDRGVPSILAHFGSVLLDEASQAVEPSSLIGALLGCEQLFLVGDPCQLPPTVVSAGAARGGLAVTLFDRLSATGVQPLLLDTQYRMHPEIARFPSEHFYHGRLASGINGTARPRPVGFAWPTAAAPVAFVSVAGEERREAADEGGSISNAREARLAAELVCAMVGAGEPPSGIGVITPYSAQVRLIERELSRRLPPRPGTRAGCAVDVRTVDGFQGCERDIILFSAVRSNPKSEVGFLADDRRLNVALTRARRGLIVLGDESTLAADHTWRQYLRWLHANSLVVAAQAGSA